MSTYEGSIKFSAEVDTKQAEDDLRRFGNTAENYTPQLDDFSESEEGVSRNAREMIDGFAMASGALSAFAGALVAAGVASVRASTEFDAAYAQVKTIMDTEAVAVGDMRQDILDLSTASGIAATDISAAVYQAISGSVDTADAVRFVDDANRLAAAGFTPLTNATDVLTTTLNAYKMSTDDVAGVSNVLIQTQNLGKTSVDELAASIGRVIPTAAAYGVDLENLTSAYVELTRSGIATAESTTYINGMLNELGKAGSNVGKILVEQTGKSFGQLMQEGSSLGDVLGILLNSVDGNSEAFANLWGSAEAGKAALSITSAGIDDFNGVLSDMQSQMEGAASTTNDAYNTMTETSEYIDKKFENSITNLGIAVGDKLRPQFDAVKSALSNVLEWMTDIVRQNPIIVAALEGMAVSAGILGVAMFTMSTAFDVAVVKIKAAFTALMAHPLVLVATAVAGVATAIIALGTSAEESTGKLADLKQETDAMKQSSNDLYDSITSGKQAFDTAIDSYNVAAQNASGYIDEIERLRNVGNKTTEQQRRYHEVLVKLSETVPELAKYIDLETDSINISTDALRKHTEQWKKDAIAAANQQYYTELLKQSAQAAVEFGVAQKRLDEYIRDHGIDMEWMNEQQKAANESAKQLKETTGESIDPFSLMTQEYWDMSEALLHLYADSGYSMLAQAVDAAAESVKEADEQISVFNGTLADASEETKEMSGSTGKLESDMADLETTFVAASDSLASAWNAAHDAISSNIDRQITMFADFGSALDDMASKTSADTESMIKSLDTQLKFMDTYAENMKKAAEMGVDEGLLASLSDGSVESANILAGIVSGTEEQISEMNEKWNAVQDGKEIFADALTEYDLEVKNHKQTLVDAATQAGIEIPENLTSGLVSGLGSFKSALNQYVSAFVAANNRMPVGSLGTIRGYASGTTYAQPGVAIVGENGPELVIFNGGEQVVTASETTRIITDAQRAQAIAATAPTPYVSAFGNGYGGAQGLSGRQDITITVPLNIDGREFARATAAEMGEQMLYV